MFVSTNEKAVSLKLQRYTLGLAESNDMKYMNRMKLGVGGGVQQMRRSVDTQCNHGLSLCMRRALLSFHLCCFLICFLVLLLGLVFSSCYYELRE
jgi:hypothetical protein